jgi:hypothetical protein
VERLAVAAIGPIAVLVDSPAGARTDALRYDRTVTTFYDIDAANARIPELREILALLRDQLAELGRLRDDGLAPDLNEADARRIQLRISGIVDQMHASVARIDAWSVTLRDIGTGLIDFPALVNGRQVCLCWQLGEDDIGWWHELSTGFAGRLPLAELA